MKKKVLATLLASSMIISALAGCGAAAETKGEDEVTTIKVLTILGNPDRDQLLKDIVAEKLGDSINVEVISPPADQSRQKMITMLQAKEDIDIIELGSVVMADYINNGWCAPLDDYIAEWDEYETISPALREQAASYDGHVYGIPYGQYQKALFYRVDWLEEAGLEVPKTWDEFYEVAKALTDPDNNRYGYALRAGSGGAGFLDYHLRCDLGSEYLTLAMSQITNERRSMFDYQEAVDVCNYWIKLFEDTANPDCLAWGYPETVEAFYSGCAALLIQDPEVIATCEQYMEDGTWAVAPIPTGKSGESWSNAGNAAWGIAAHTEKKDAAWKVIEALSGAEANATWCKANGNLPVQAKAFEDPYFAEGHYKAYSIMGEDPDTYKWFADASETLWMTKEELDIQASDGQENTKFQELLIGAITPEEYLEYRKSFHAWIEDSEWLKEVYPD